MSLFTGEDNVTAYDTIKSTPSETPDTGNVYLSVVAVGELLTALTPVGSNSLPSTSPPAELPFKSSIEIWKLSLDSCKNDSLLSVSTTMFPPLARTTFCFLTETSSGVCVLT